MYTKRQFGKELKERIESDFDVLKISRWAHDEVLVKHRRKIDLDFERTIMQIIAMDMGKEFEFSKAELLDFAGSITN